MKAIVRKVMHGNPTQPFYKYWVVFGLKIASVECNIRGSLIWSKRVLIFGIPVYDSEVF